MTLVEFLALCLAAGAVVDVWFQGEIFSTFRGAVVSRVARAESTGHRPPLWASVLDCWFCMMHWVAGLLVLGLVLPGEIYQPARTLLWLPIYTLAAIRAASLLNMLLPEHMQHDTSDLEENDEPRDDNVVRITIDPNK